MNLKTVILLGRRGKILRFATASMSSFQSFPFQLKPNYISVCSDDLTSLATITASASSDTAQHSFIYSRTTWCASSSDYVDVDLMMPRMVTGIGIQGDSNNDQWVKTFKLSHGLSTGSMQQTGAVSCHC